MAIRNIVKEGDSTLRQVCRPVSVFDERLGLLLDDMYETMVKADGVGIAAPQVGVLKRVCIVCVDGTNVIEMVNPVILKSSGAQVGYEGCLSVPGVNGKVTRPKKMTIEAYDRHGEKTKFNVSGYEAIACSHEIDHLDGVLFIDKVEKDDEDED